MNLKKNKNYEIKIMTFQIKPIYYNKNNHFLSIYIIKEREN